MKNGGWTLFWLVLFGLFYAGASHVFDRVEVAECKKWQQQAREYKDFYLTPWQSEQCKYHEVEISAPVLDVEEKLSFLHEEVHVGKKEYSFYVGEVNMRGKTNYCYSETNVIKSFRVNNDGEIEGDVQCFDYKKFQ